MKINSLTKGFSELTIYYRIHKLKRYFVTFVLCSSFNTSNKETVKLEATSIAHDNTFAKLVEYFFIFARSLRDFAKYIAKIHCEKSDQMRSFFGSENAYQENFVFGHFHAVLL